MAGEVGCRLQTPVLLRRPVLKKIHSCHKHAQSVYEGRGGALNREELSLLSCSSGCRGEAHRKSSWDSKSSHASRQLSATYGGDGSPPLPQQPCAKTQPFCKLGVPGSNLDQILQGQCGGRGSAGFAFQAVAKRPRIQEQTLKNTLLQKRCRHQALNADLVSSWEGLGT